MDLAEFLRRFPNADMRQFTRSRIQGRPEIAGKSRRGWWKNWDRALRVALLVGNSHQLMLTKNVKQPVPAVDFANSIACVDGLFNQEQNMHVTPTEYLSTENFLQTRSKHTTRRETKAWPGGPNMKYWPQQLNFALWCATTSCGVPRDICCRQMYHSNVDPLVLHWYICNDVEKADQWYIKNGKKNIKP